MSDRLSEQPLRDVRYLSDNPVVARRIAKRLLLGEAIVKVAREERVKVSTLKAFFEKRVRPLINDELKREAASGWMARIGADYGPVKAPSGMARIGNEYGPVKVCGQQAAVRTRLVAGVEHPVVSGRVETAGDQLVEIGSAAREPEIVYDNKALVAAVGQAPGEIDKLLDESLGADEVAKVYIRRMRARARRRDKWYDGAEGRKDKAGNPNPDYRELVAISGDERADMEIEMRTLGVLDRTPQVPTETKATNVIMIRLDGLGAGISNNDRTVLGRSVVGGGDGSPNSNRMILGQTLPNTANLDASIIVEQPQEHVKQPSGPAKQAPEPAEDGLEEYEVAG